MFSWFRSQANWVCFSPLSQWSEPTDQGHARQEQCNDEAAAADPRRQRQHSPLAAAAAVPSSRFQFIFVDGGGGGGSGGCGKCAELPPPPEVRINRTKERPSVLETQQR